MFPESFCDKLNKIEKGGGILENWKLSAQQAKDLLALCLANGIQRALSQQIGPFWFLEFARIDQQEEEKKRITRPGQSSVNDLDLQALLKILRYREDYTDRILTFYGFSLYFLNCDFIDIHTVLCVSGRT